MIVQGRRLRGGLGLMSSILVLMGVTGVAFSTLTAAWGGFSRLELPGRSSESFETVLERRLDGVDQALARGDIGAAIREWRDGHAVALGTRRWHAMAAIGDAATRIDAAGGPGRGYPGSFRAEARQAYLRALFLARAAGSADGIERVAQAFQELGDGEMAARARAMVVKP